MNKKISKAKKKTRTRSSYIEKISRPPGHSRSEFHYWVDYIELLCIINPDSILSQNDFIDRIKGQPSPEDNNQNKTNVEINTKNGQFAEDCFSIIQYRINSFKAYYPFKISKNNKNIVLQKNLTQRHKIYLFLLFSSSLNYFNEFKTQFTSSFELVSLESLGNLLPARNSGKTLFGSSNIDNKLLTKTHLWSKITLLTSQIKENALIKKGDLSPFNKGDGGLDLVGWVDLGDSNRHFPLYFCQCACTPKWTAKQNSSKFDKWSNLITFSTYPINIIFIPFSFRKANGEWHDPLKIEKSVLMDRLRVVQNYDPYLQTFKKLSCKNIVDKILSQKESFV